MIALRAAAWYLPSTAVTVAELPELTALTEVERETCRALGIQRVPVDDDLDAPDLAARAAQKALAEAGLDPEMVDALITVESRAPDTFVSSEATRMQAILGARRAVAFSVGGLGCASITPALLAARGLLCGDPDMSNVLVVHGSKPVTGRRYRHPVTVNGDCGQALVVSKHGPIRIRDMLLDTSGEYWDLFQVEFRDRPCDQWREECTDLPKYSFRLAVETRNRLRELNRRILERNGLRQDEVSCYLTQNLSTGSFRIVEETLGVEIASACSDNLRRCGHLGPNDVLLNLYSAIEQEQLPGCGRAILFNVSPAAAWSALLVETGNGAATEAHHL